MTKQEREELNQLAHHLDELLELQKFLVHLEKSDVLELLFALQHQLNEMFEERITV